MESYNELIIINQLVDMLITICYRNITFVTLNYANTGNIICILTMD